MTLNGESMFPTYQDLGVGLYSIQARWDQIAPTEPAEPSDPLDPAYVWPEYLDFAVSEATEHGMKVQILIMGAPPWSNGGKGWKWSPRDPLDFADFATAISGRYPSVDHWMIWGEPNRKPNFGPFTPATDPTGKLNKDQQAAPRTYAKLLDLSYRALKADDPSNLVIGGNTYTASGKTGDINTYQWIRYMKLPGGHRPRMDMWGHNPWGSSIPNLKAPPSPRGAVTFSDLRRLAKRLDQAFPGQKLKLFLAEWGVPTGFRDLDLGYSLKAKEATAWVKAAFKIARSWKRIYTIGWVHPVDTERNSTGFLDPDGNRKPTYNAFKAG